VSKYFFLASRPSVRAQIGQQADGNVLETACSLRTPIASPIRQVTVLHYRVLVVGIYLRERVLIIHYCTPSSFACHFHLVLHQRSAHTTQASTQKVNILDALDSITAPISVITLIKPGPSGQHRFQPYLSRLFINRFLGLFSFEITVEDM
jgi:hypothetical protein